jgi:hypothetical protein
MSPVTAPVTATTSAIVVPFVVPNKHQSTTSLEAISVVVSHEITCLRKSSMVEHPPHELLAPCKILLFLK